MRVKPLELIEHPGALQLLLTLSDDSEKHYITSVLRRSINPKGFISQTALDDCRRNFATLGLMYEKIDKGPRPKTFLVITEKGKRVAEKIREIQEILEE